MAAFRFAHAWLAAACVLLSACSSAPVSDAPVRPARESIRAFALDGRVSVTRAAERAHVSIGWQHDDHADGIDVFNPLGSQLARLTRDGGGARLETADRKRFDAASLDELSERVFGSRLPLGGMPQWVLGRKVARDARAELDAQGRIAALADGGWQIRYLEYESASPNALPRLIDMEHDDLWVRLVVDAWRELK